MYSQPSSTTREHLIHQGRQTTRTGMGHVASEFQLRGKIEG